MLEILGCWSLVLECRINFWNNRVWIILLLVGAIIPWYWWIIWALLWIYLLFQDDISFRWEWFTEFLPFGSCCRLGCLLCFVINLPGINLRRKTFSFGVLADAHLFSRFARFLFSQLRWWFVTSYRILCLLQISWCLFLFQNCSWWLCCCLLSLLLDQLF